MLSKSTKTLAQDSIWVQNLWRIRNPPIEEFTENLHIEKHIIIAQQQPGYLDKKGNLQYSFNYIRKNILKQSDEEIEELDKEMAVDIAKMQEEQMKQLQMQQMAQGQE